MTAGTIRLASLADEAALTEFLERSYRLLLPAAYEPRVVEAAVPGLAVADFDLLGSDTFRVAEEGGVIVGCGGWAPWSPTGAEDGRAHVRHVVTAPERLRRGIGRAMLAECLAEATAEGFSEAEALTTLGAQPFFEQAGFRARGLAVLPLQGGGELPAVRMVAGLG